MHIKHRGQRALLYRSSWVKKGTEGNTHGFSRQTYLGSIVHVGGNPAAYAASKLRVDTFLRERWGVGQR